MKDTRKSGPGDSPLQCRGLGVFLLACLCFGSCTADFGTRKSACMVRVKFRRAVGPSLHVLGSTAEAALISLASYNSISSEPIVQFTGALAIKFHMDSRSLPHHHLHGCVRTLCRSAGSFVRIFPSQTSRTDFMTGRQFHMGIILIEKSNVVVSSRQQSKSPTTARAKARCVPFLVWSPGVRVESKLPKNRPLASTGVQIQVC